jgi:putative peptide zinc metalloprotease protein
LDDNEIKDLELRSPQAGVLVTPDLESEQSAYLHRGDPVGVVADLHKLIIRAAVANELGGPLDTEASRRVEIRVDGRPDILLTGRIAARVPAGSNQLPSAALGYQVGGEFSTATDDREGTKTVDTFFEVRIDDIVPVEKGMPPELWDAYKKTGRLPLLPGQRVVVRFDLKPKPIAEQVWTSLLQLFQRKFQI